MLSNKNQLLCVTMLVIFFIVNSPPTCAAKLAPKPSESYKVVADFCNRRSTSEDRVLCLRVLKSNPNITFAKNNISLLYISVDLAVENVNKTKEYMTTLSKRNATKPSPLIPVLKECIAAYDRGIGQLLIITHELKDDPALASYDALMAYDELITCENSFKTSEIADDSISSRLKIAKAYVELCVDIARRID